MTDFDVIQPFPTFSQAIFHALREFDAAQVSRAATPTGAGSIRR